MLDRTARILDLVLQLEVDRAQPQARNHLRVQSAQERVGELESLQGFRFSGPANRCYRKAYTYPFKRIRSSPNIIVSAKTVLSQECFLLVIEPGG
jgi:hypothetical protein